MTVRSGCGFTRALYKENMQKEEKGVYVCGETLCVCVCVCVVTGEGEGVRGVMLQSFLAVAGDEGADKLSPEN